MRFYLFSLLGFTVFFISGCGQLKVVDYISTITSNPIERKISITDLTYREGKFNKQERHIKNFKVKLRNIHNDLGRVIDDAKLINYKSDTLYLLSTYYIPDGSTDITIKTNKGAFDIIYNKNTGYSLRPLEDSYINTPEEVRLSDFLLYEAIFTWDIDMLTQLIKLSGSPSSSAYSTTATRIILKDNQVIEKDIINFLPAVRWIK